MTLPKRKPNRLKHYDYSKNGAYFVTICVKDRNEMLWADVGADNIRPHNTPQLSVYGFIIDDSIKSIEKHYSHATVDKYVIMPNHVHMIILLLNDDFTTQDGRIISAPTKDISTIIGQMKRMSSKRSGFSIWQKSFHDHIIRNEQEYCKVWEYIDTNPLKWEDDCFYGIHNKLNRKSYCLY